MTSAFKPEFPLIWDSSMRSDFVDCPRAFFWKNIHHFRAGGDNVHLHAGKAWAGALEVARKEYYEEAKSQEEAVETGLAALVNFYGDFVPPSHGSGSAKSLDRLIEAFAHYFAAYPFSSDPAQPYISPATNKPMIEFSFCLPLAADLVHPETGEPLLFSGRADMVATYAGAVTLYDDKTATALGDQWAKQWQRRGQFTGYCWAGREYGIPITQVLARGIAILKTSIKHADALTVRTDHHIREWHAQFVRDIRRAIACWKEGYWDVNLSDGCSSYGGCAFLQPCTSSDPMPWLESQFVRKSWNPATREEILISSPFPTDLLEANLD